MIMQQSVAASHQKIQQLFGCIGKFLQLGTIGWHGESGRCPFLTFDNIVFIHVVTAEHHWTRRWMKECKKGRVKWVAATTGAATAQCNKEEWRWSCACETKANQVCWNKFHRRLLVRQCLGIVRQGKTVSLKPVSRMLSCPRSCHVPSEHVLRDLLPTLVQFSFLGTFPVWEQPATADQQRIKGIKGDTKERTKGACGGGGEDVSKLFIQHIYTKLPVWLPHVNVAPRQRCPTSMLPHLNRDLSPRKRGVSQRSPWPFTGRGKALCVESIMRCGNI